jgi:ferredoxin
MKSHLQFETPTINPIIGVAKIEETLLPAMSLPIALVLSSGGNCTPISVVAIESKPLKNGENYMRKEWSENGVKRMIAKPEHDAGLCTQCNTCVNSCPMAAIDPETYEADGDTCIRCMACVKVCPENAKSIMFPQRVTQFLNTWEKGLQPELFL